MRRKGDGALPQNPNPVESFNVTTEFELQGDCLVWYARPQLFFNCTLCPTGAKGPGFSASHKEVSLVYFSTFEPIDLTPDSIVQRAGVPMLYDSASNLRLYICPVANVLGSSPLIPCFICGNSHPTIPHMGVFEAPLPTRSGTGATAAGSTR